MSQNGEFSFRLKTSRIQNASGPIQGRILGGYSTGQEQVKRCPARRPPTLLRLSSTSVMSQTRSQRPSGKRPRRAIEREIGQRYGDVVRPRDQVNRLGRIDNTLQVLPTDSPYYYWGDVQYLRPQAVTTMWISLVFSNLVQLYPSHQSNFSSSQLLLGTLSPTHWPCINSPNMTFPFIDK